MQNEHRSYTTPKPSTQYSAEFYKDITFSSAKSLQYPDIAPKSSVTKWAFDYTVPETRSDIEVSPVETIPHIDDIQPMCSGMESAFHNGHRSVVLAMSLDGKEKCYRYHMSKVSCIRRQSLVDQRLINWYIVRFASSSRSTIIARLSTGHRSSMTMSLQIFISHHLSRTSWPVSALWSRLQGSTSRPFHCGNWAAFWKRTGWRRMSRTHLQSYCTFGTRQQTRIIHLSTSPLCFSMTLAACFIVSHVSTTTIFANYVFAYRVQEPLGSGHRSASVIIIQQHTTVIAERLSMATHCNDFPHPMHSTYFDGQWPILITRFLTPWMRVISACSLTAAMEAAE